VKNGDTPVLWVYPPEELSDESVHAISEFMYSICQAFDKQYARQLSQVLYTKEDRISNFKCEAGEDDEPF
jgi:hypothetical protein